VGGRRFQARDQHHGYCSGSGFYRNRRPDSESSQVGAYNVLLKPFQREQLIFAVRRALEHRRLKIENFFLKDKLGLGSGIDFSLSELVESRRKAGNRGKGA
jgi:hypothetical protein